MRTSRSPSQPAQGSPQAGRSLAVARSQQQLDERRPSKASGLGRKASANLASPDPSRPAGRRNSAGIRVKFHNFRRQLYGALVASVATRGTGGGGGGGEPAPGGHQQGAKKQSSKASKQVIARDCCLYLSGFRRNSGNQARQDSLELALDSEPSSLGAQSVFSKEDQLQSKFDTTTVVGNNNNNNQSARQSLASRFSNRAARQLAKTTNQQQHQLQHPTSGATAETCKLVDLLDQFAAAKQTTTTAGETSLTRRDEAKCLRLERSWTEFVHLRTSNNNNNNNHNNDKDVDDPSGRDKTIRATASCQNLDLTGSSASVPTLKAQQDAIWELISTEQFYIRRLRLVIDLFLASLLYLQDHLFLLEVSINRVTLVVLVVKLTTRVSFAFEPGGCSKVN